MRKLIALLALFGTVAIGRADDVSLKIEGMSCPQGCVKKVDGALAKIKGVSSKKVEVGKATVTFDAKQTSRKEIVAAIEKTGFKVVN